MTGTGYHNDQFFNIGAAGEPGSAQKVDGQSTFVPTKADNLLFSYPDNQIRTEDHTGRRNQTLKKGYMRSMLTSNSGVKVSLRKCQFQFNPTTLQQSVSSNTAMLNFLQQDPAQYAQPMPGNVNFSFTLFFDRSMEVNNAKSAVISNPNTDADLWRENSPGQVGVLHDLSALFGVVGQGLSKSQKEYMAAVLQDTVVAEANASTQEDSVTQGEKAINNIATFLDINIGNSAFLLPVPVRVVFSSLYIVEGLVTNTTVAFTKFSSTLIPMQCSVTVTMEAKYVGFAKAKTFFTESLKAREAADLQEKQEATARKGALVDAFAVACKKARVTWWRIDDPASKSSSTSYEQNADQAFVEQDPIYLRVLFPSAKGADQPITDEFDSSSGLFVQVGGSYEVYRSTNSLAGFRGDLGSYVAQQDLESVLSATFTPGPDHGTARSTKDWETLRNGHSSSTSVKAKDLYTSSAQAGVAGDWFIARVTVKVQVTTPEREVVEAKNEIWKVFGPGVNWFPSVDLSPVWPKIVVSDSSSSSSSGYVPSSNAGTNPPPPGGSSKVGAPVVSTKPAPKPGVVVRE